MLTIGQLAGFAGVTVRTVRHYHGCGLLPEPERDASGYRRYDAQAVVDLIRIRTLADAGVPLSRVRTLLDADEQEFRAAVDVIDRALREKIRRTQEHRRRISRLAAGESLVLPDFVVAYLQLMRDHGIGERTVAIERDGWTLIAVSHPDRVEDWIRLKADLLDDPVYLRLYRGLDQALAWAPDDPRLVELAESFVAYARDSVGDDAHDGPDAPRGDEFDDVTLALLEAQTSDVSPSWRRLRELLAEFTQSG